MHPTSSRLQKMFKHPCRTYRKCSNIPAERTENVQTSLLNECPTCKKGDRNRRRQEPRHQPRQQEGTQKSHRQRTQKSQLEKLIGSSSDARKKSRKRTVSAGVATAADEFFQLQFLGSLPVRFLGSFLLPQLVSWFLPAPVSVTLLTCWTFVQQGCLNIFCLQLSVGFGDTRENKKMIRKALLDSISENKGCLPSDLMIVNMTLAFFNGILAVVAFSQLLRIHMRDRNKGWTRQKVLHFMIGSSNLGYFIYFISTHIATCKRWLCWSHVCGFILMAYPKILFLAAFLLLLSFWVDLCHQANDEEDEYDENNIQKALLEKSKNNCGSSNTDGHRICCSIQSLHVGSRQKIVIVVVALVFIFMMSCAVVIWIGAGKNPIDSSIVAQVYEDFLSTAVLLLGGALGCYGLLLFSKLRKVRSEKASSDMWKVSGLAVVSVVCFTSSALVALLTDIPVYYHWRLRTTFGVRVLMFVILYYLIGSLVPSAFLLWITRELPPPTTSQTEQSRTIFIRRATDDTTHRQQWAAATSSKNQASRASPI